MLNSLGATGMAPRDGDLRSPSRSTADRSELFSQISNVLKLKIGVIMMLTALVAMVITPGPQPNVLEMLVLAFAFFSFLFFGNNLKEKNLRGKHLKPAYVFVK